MQKFIHPPMLWFWLKILITWTRSLLFCCCCLFFNFFFHQEGSEKHVWFSADSLHALAVLCYVFNCIELKKSKALYWVFSSASTGFSILVVSLQQIHGIRELNYYPAYLPLKEISAPNSDQIDESFIQLGLENLQGQRWHSSVSIHGSQLLLIIFQAVCICVLKLEVDDLQVYFIFQKTSLASNTLSHVCPC